ncbi:phosphatidylethanolamine-binding protein [Phlyctema vagabunda]|uniref:Phosphatidylethanolamine-binding protein n=1 Tax=Phlyctema vagabunda TaxID=108571 RepID=A0ABR4P8C8_9HELO
MSLSSHVQEVKTSLVSAGLATGSVALLPADLDLTTNLSVTFGDKSVGLGNLLRSSDCKTAPKISFSAEAGHESHAYTYTLFLVDPDAPTPDDPKFAYWRHWVVSGLEPSSTHTSSSSSSSQSALTEYLGPGPKDERVSPQAPVYPARIG